MTEDSKIMPIDWFNQTLQDGGPLYTESNPGRLIAEPWNALSSLFIVFPAFIWLLRVRKDYKNFRFLLFCISLMVLGGTGSTIFHAFRASKFFLVMDVLPTAVLSLSLGIYFWSKLKKKWWYVMLLIFLFVVPRFLFFRNLPQHAAINVSYAFSGIFIGLPLLIILFKNSWYRTNQVVYAIFLFIVALVFRETDTFPISFFPMGTHFLWHVFSGFGAYCILAYLYAFRKKELSLLTKDAPDNQHTIL